MCFMSTLVRRQNGRPSLNSAASYKNTLSRALDTIDLGNVGIAIEVLAEARAHERTIFVCGNGRQRLHCFAFLRRSRQRSQHFSASPASACTRSLILCRSSQLTATTWAMNPSSLSNSRTWLNAATCLLPSALPAIHQTSCGLRSMRIPSAARPSRSPEATRQLGAMAQLQIRVAEPHMGRIEDSHMASVT